MQYTPNYNLRQPEEGDLYNVQDFNTNASIIDETLKNIDNYGHDTSTDLALHIADTNNPHSVSKEQLGLGNVENKDSETIRNEITSENITMALGYTPLDVEKRNVIEGYLDSTDLDEHNWHFYYHYDSSSGTFEDIVPIYPDRIYVNLLNDKIYRYDSEEYVFDEISKSLTPEERQKLEHGNTAYNVRANSIWMSNYSHDDSSDNHIYAEPDSYSLVDNNYDDNSNTLVLLGKNVTISNAIGDDNYIELPEEVNPAELYNAVKFEVTGTNVTNALGYTPARLDNTSNDMVGATSVTNGSHGFVPAPQAGDQDKALFGDGSWRTVSSGGGGSGTDDYSDLSNKPSINNVILNGNKSLSDLGIVDTDATSSTHGLMSSTDKAKLDSIDADAGTIPSGGSSGQILGWLSNGQAQWIDFPITPVVTVSSNGLMLAEDKVKLDGITNNANYTVVKGDAENEYRSGQVNLTPANIGLGNVGNFKAVSTVSGQGLTDEEKLAARTNIGAGSSNFDGDYYSLSNLPVLGTACTKDVASTITGTYNLPTDRAVKDYIDNKDFVTKTVNDLVNYYNKSNTYNKTEIDALIDTIPKFSIEVVQELPTEDISTSTIYLVPSADPSTRDIYTEYIYVNDSWEKLGAQRIDLTGIIYGEGSSNHLAVFSDTDTIEDGPEFGIDTTKFLRNDGQWATPDATTDTTYTLSYTNSVLSLIGSDSSVSSVTIEGGSSTVDWDDVTNKPSFGTASLADTTSSVTGSSDLPTDLAVKTYVDTALAGKASTAVATTSTNGLMSSTDKVKLNVMPTLTRVQGTLLAGETSITLVNAAITTNSYIEVYTSIFGKVTISCVPTNGYITLTYEAEQNDMDVEVWVRNFPSA